MLAPTIEKGNGKPFPFLIFSYDGFDDADDLGL